MRTKEVAGQIVLSKRRANTMGLDILSLRPMGAEFERFGTWYVKNVAIDDYTQPVVYTMQTRARKENKLGHFQAAYAIDDEDGQRYAWSSKEGDAAHEINIVPEALLRDPYEVLAIEAHEIIHMYNWNSSIVDVGKSGIHREAFKESAEMFGLVCERHAKKSIGWTTVGFTDELRKRIENEFVPDLAAFNMFKEALPAPKPTRKSTVAIHVLEDTGAPVLRMAKGKASEAIGHLTWTKGKDTYEYVIKPEV